MQRIILGISAVALALVLGVSAVGAQTMTDTSTQVLTQFNRNLTIGSSGTDVAALQTILVNQGYLVIPTGVSKGYFGQLTKNAVAKWQAAVGISPAAGYFGPISRAKINSSATVGGSNPGTTPGTNPGTTTPGTNNPGTGLSGGETSLEDFDASSGSDSEAEEGQDSEIADFEFDVEDGDAMIDRIDVSFQGLTTEEDPWETFDNVAILVDGKVVADEDTDDEDAWSEEEDEIGSTADDYSIRFTNLDWKVKEGDMAEFTVRVTAADGVDDLPATWLIGIGDEGIRATDSEGIDNYIGNDADTVSFSVEEAGQDEELTITESDNNPESNTLQIEDNTSSDWYEILAFDIEGEENDIEITELPITLTFTGSEDYGDVINDIMLEVDGEEYDDVTVLNDANSTTTVTFDFDRDELVVDADSTVTAKLMVRFNSGDTIDNGDTLVADITSANVDAIEAEGAEDLDDSQLTGSVDGNIFTLRENGISVTKSNTAPKVTVTSQDAADGGDYGTYVIKFKVTAFEEEAWVPLTAATTGLVGADYHVTGSGASSTATTTGSLEVESGVTKTNSRARIPAGQTKEFTLSVVINAATDGFYGVELQEVAFATSSTATAVEYTVPDEDEFEVDDTFISAN